MRRSVGFRPSRPSRPSLPSYRGPSGSSQVLPLTKQLTSLAGNLWGHSLQGKRAERIEYLLLHEFHRLK
eukprot:scaffold191331_cov30-Tisochrysis_lutea.AAC.3